MIANNTPTINNIELPVSQADNSLYQISYFFGTIQSPKMGDNFLNINGIDDISSILRVTFMNTDIYINASFSKLFPNTALLSTSRKFSSKVA